MNDKLLPDRFCVADETAVLVIVDWLVEVMATGCALEPLEELVLLEPPQPASSATKSNETALETNFMDISDMLMKKILYFYLGELYVQVFVGFAGQHLCAHAQYQSTSPLSY